MLSGHSSCLPPLINIINTVIKIYISQLKDPHKPLQILLSIIDWGKCLVEQEGTKSVGFKSRYEALAQKKKRHADNEVKELSLQYPCKLNTCLPG